VPDIFMVVKGLAGATASLLQLDSRERAVEFFEPIQSFGDPLAGVVLAISIFASTKLCKRLG
jgi:hypothetical protein